MDGGYLRALFLVAGLVLSLWLPGAAMAEEAKGTIVPLRVAVDADGVQRAHVILDSYSYRPDHLIVGSGKPVELILTSQATMTPHNFIIEELSIEQDVGAGKTVTITFTPTRSGIFTIYCDKRLWPLPSHRDKGMVGTLEVK